MKERTTRDMGPGPNLDALVAEKVMRAGKSEVAFLRAIDTETKTVTILTELHYPPYSTEIAAAWEVVQALIKMNHYVALDYSLVTQSWSCTLAGGGGDSRSAPHAICLAALEAVKAT